MSIKNWFESGRLGLFGGLSLAFFLVLFAICGPNPNPQVSDGGALQEISHETHSHSANAGKPRANGHLSFRAIESIQVGQRVLTGLPSDEVPRTQVDSASWKKLTLSVALPWVDGTADVLRIKTLQSPEWLKSNHVHVGARVPIPVDIAELGGSEDLLAIVDSIQECPTISSGRGRVVLTTTNHLSATCRSLQVRSQDGKADQIETTNNHPFWSESRQVWVKAHALRIGEILNGINGNRVELVASSALPGVHTIYNMTVESEHVYRVGILATLVHNTSPSPEGVVKGYRAASAAELADINDNGFRPGRGSLGAKWFANTQGGAKTHRSNYPDNTHIIEVEVPRSVHARAFQDPAIDGFGGFAIPEEDLSSIKWTRSLLD